MGADAIGGGDQNGAAEAGELIACSETADVGYDAAGEGRPGELFDGGDGTIGLVDVDTGVAVAEGFGRQVSV